MTCSGCKWLENNMWCAKKCSGRHKSDPKCIDYDNSPRRFNPKYIYRLCKDYIEMYDNLSSKKFNPKTRNIDTVFGDIDVELISFVLNDMKRELKYYERWKLDEDLNQEFVFKIIEKPK